MHVDGGAGEAEGLLWWSLPQFRLRVEKGGPAGVSLPEGGAEAAGESRSD